MNIDVKKYNLNLKETGENIGSIELNTDLVSLTPAEQSPPKKEKPKLEPQGPDISVEADFKEFFLKPFI